MLMNHWEDFISNTTMFDKDGTKKLTKMVDWKTWMTAPGPSPIAGSYLDFSTDDSKVAFKLAEDYANLQGPSPFNLQGFNAWYPNKQVLFVDRLLALNSEGKITIRILESIDADLNITKTIQPEVMQRWFPLGIMNNYAPVFNHAKNFVSIQGRMKYLNPIYTSLVQNGHRDTAFEWFKMNEMFYHPIARATLKKILLLGQTREDEVALEKHEAYKNFLKE